MGRVACIEFPQLPLQLALRSQQQGQTSEPLAVVREDKPSAPILYLNQAAQSQGLKLGMRYSEALSIVAGLRGVTVSTHELAQIRQQIRAVLGRWSPVVEESPFDPGCFWLAASGLAGLYGTETQWGKAIRQALQDEKLRAVVVIGSTRSGTWVLARTRKRSTVLTDPVVEQRAFQAAPLGVFPLPTRHRRLLERLGIRTLADLLRFPPADLARRFGPELLREVRLLQQLDSLPLQQATSQEPWTASQRLGFPLADRERLAPLVVALLLPGMDLLARRGRLLAELRLVLVLENGELVSEVLRPAQPTTQPGLVRRLVELRLSQGSFPCAVTELRMTLLEVDAPPQTGELFVTATRRNLQQGEETLALIRAKFGNASVVHAVLADSHVPERSFEWREVEHLTPPTTPRLNQSATAVRRLFQSPQRSVPGQRLAGPLLLQSSTEAPPIDREDWYLRSPRQEVQWVSLDRQTHEATLTGVVD